MVLFIYSVNIKPPRHRFCLSLRLGLAKLKAQICRLHADRDKQLSIGGAALKAGDIIQETILDKQLCKQLLQQRLTEVNVSSPELEKNLQLVQTQVCQLTKENDRRYDIIQAVNEARIEAGKSKYDILQKAKQDGLLLQQKLQPASQFTVTQLFEYVNQLFEYDYKEYFRSKYEYYEYFLYKQGHTHETILHSYKLCRVWQPTPFQAMNKANQNTQSRM